MKNMALEKLHAQLRSFFRTDKFEILALAGGASARRYYEINFRKKLYFPSPRILLMHVPITEMDSLTDYVHIDFYLNRAGVPTPRVYEINKQFGWIFLEYQNIPTLLRHLKSNPGAAPDLLEKLIEFLIIMQERCQYDRKCPAFQRFFDRDKYLYEFNFHVKEQLIGEYFKRRLTGQELQDFQEFSVEIGRTLDTGDKVFVHRDFQSSNIFYDKARADPKFTVIDFQDARAGTPVYDLVSCLWDSYIPIADDLREYLLEKYFRHFKEGRVFSRDRRLSSADGFQKLVDYAVAQRKLHDAGAFAYNFKRFGEKRFTAFIPNAIQMALEKMKPHNQFKKVINIFEKLLSTV